MHKVGLFDCVTGQGWLTNLSNRCLYLEGISEKFGKRRFRVIRTEGLQIHLVETAVRFSLFATCIKIILIATLILPLLMILIKRRNLKLKRFVFPQKPQEAPPGAAAPVHPDPHKAADPLPAFPVPEPMPPFTPAPKGDQNPDPNLDPWPAAKSLSQIQREFKPDKPAPKVSKPAKNEEADDATGLKLNLRDSKGEERKVDRARACKASAVLEAACRSAMKEARKNCYISTIFDDGVLDSVSTWIQEGKFPLLDLQGLMRFYIASDHLQMDTLSCCRNKLIEHLLYGTKIDEKTVIKLWEIADKHQDVALQILVMSHLWTNHMEIPSMLTDKYEHLKRLQTSQMRLEVDQRGALTAIMPELTLETLHAIKTLRIEQLVVQKLFETQLAENLTGIRSLTLADKNNFQLKEETLSALFKNAKLLSNLKLCYCNLDESASESLAVYLQGDSKITSLIFTAVSFKENGFSEIATALKQNKTVKFLQISHGSLNDAGLEILLEALKENQTLQTVCLKENGFSSKSLSKIQKSCFGKKIEV